MYKILYFSSDRKSDAAPPGGVPSVGVKKNIKELSFFFVTFVKSYAALLL